MTPEEVTAQLSITASNAFKLCKWLHLPRKEQNKQSPAEKHGFVTFLENVDFGPLCEEKERLLDEEHLEYCLSAVTSDEVIVHIRGGDVLPGSRLVVGRPSEITCGDIGNLIQHYASIYGFNIDDNQYVVVCEGYHFPISELYTINVPKCLTLLAKLQRIHWSKYGTLRDSIELQ